MPEEPLTTLDRLQKECMHPPAARVVRWQRVDLDDGAVAEELVIMCAACGAVVRRDAAAGPLRLVHVRAKDDAPVSE